MSCTIRSWIVSYYAEHQRKWISGQLTCSAIDVSFVCDKTLLEECNKIERRSDEEHDTKSDSGLRIQYSDIKEVRKTTSMLIYAAITLETRDGTVHWFSSLPNKHSVYNMIYHFAHQNLTGESTAPQVMVVNPAVQTERGQQLLRSAEDSQRALAAAASDLWNQGRQLADCSIKVLEMHEDLDVADGLLSGLNSWLGRWRLPPQYKQTEAVLVGKDDIPVDQDYEVLCSLMSRDKLHPQQLCVLRTAQTGIAILDMQQRPLHSMRWFELARVFIVSPWEVVLTKHVAGRADVSVSVVSAALLPILQLLQSRVPHLVDYQSPPEVVQQGNRTERGSESMKGTQKSSCVPGNSRTARMSSERKDAGSMGTDFGKDQPEELQTRQLHKEQMSDAELRVLSSHLGGLKMLATAVGEEVMSQNKTLDELTASVDHADSRIQDATLRIKRLI